MDAFNKQSDSTIVITDYAEYRDGNVEAKTTNLKIKRLMLNVLYILPKSKFWRNRVLSFEMQYVPFGVL